MLGHLTSHTRTDMTVGMPSFKCLDLEVRLKVWQIKRNKNENLCTIVTSATF